MLEFIPFNAAPSLAPGLVLRSGENTQRFLRLTHVFRDCVYVMWVGQATGAISARRPARMLLTVLEELAASPTAVWGRLKLPTSLSSEPAEGSTQKVRLDSAWSLIQPLVSAYTYEKNLHRQNFMALIRQRALETDTSLSTVHRTVLRYYYFGGTRFGLLPLPTGIPPGSKAHSSTTDSQKPSKRRGRQSALAQEMGGNQFTVSELDVEDMLACFKRLLAKGPTFKSIAHEEYLATEFRTRHRELSEQYNSGKTPEPVTARQFRYYVDNHLRVSEDLARNVRTYQRNKGYLGSVRTTGPGEVYEIDSTGGRLHLVSRDAHPAILGKPTIYLLIDRWSRYVVSAYMSLRSASYEEVRHALLIAFTSREPRFQRLGINVTDERWPIGRMPAVICPDRGSDFMSESMEQSVVNDLLIELTPLPPLCPDGKAIVERLIRELKRRMKASGIKGAYADRPMEPRTKKAARNAEAAAVHTLTDAYRCLIDVIVDHNNRPHRSLRRNRLLAQVGVSPTPKNAYLWGLEHITGLKSAPLDEEDYYRLLLSTDKASIANGVLLYKSRPYLPDNEQAAELARMSTRRSKSIGIRLDKTQPSKILVPGAQGRWAKFLMTPGASNEIAGLALDEEEALASHIALLWDRAEHQGRVTRVAAKSEKRKNSHTGQPGASKLPKAIQIAARNHETANMKADLLGSPRMVRRLATPDELIEEPDWKRFEEEERLRNLALIRKHRGK